MFPSGSLIASLSWNTEIHLPFFPVAFYLAFILRSIWEKAGINAIRQQRQESSIKRRFSLWETTSEQSNWASPCRCLPLTKSEGCDWTSWSAEMHLIWFHHITFLDTRNLEVPNPFYRLYNSNCETNYSLSYICTREFFKNVFQRKNTNDYLLSLFHFLKALHCLGSMELGITKTPDGISHKTVSRI